MNVGGAVVLIAGLLISGPVIGQECASACDAGLTCAYCGAIEAADGQQRKIHHCVPTGMACLIDLESAANPPQAFSSGPSDIEKMGKVIVDTPQKIRDIEAQRDREKKFKAEVLDKLKR